MSDTLKVESVHVEGSRRKSSLAGDPSKLQVTDASRRRQSRASPTAEIGQGGASSSRKSLVVPSPGSARRRSSNTYYQQRRTSAATFALRRQKVQYENTYRMEPTVKFRADLALTVLREVFDRRLRGAKYDVKTCQELARAMATEIKQKVKDLKVDRYKYVVVVTIGQRQDSELILASRCLLDTNWDTYATYNFENFHVFATGIVYAFYFE